MRKSRHRFTGQRGSIEKGFTVRHYAVERDPLADTDDDGFADEDILGIDENLLTVAKNRRAVGTERHQFRNRTAGALFSVLLKQLADAEQHHNRDGLGILAHGKCSQRRDRHQKILREEVSAQKVPGGTEQYLAAAYQVTCGKYRDPEPGGILRKQKTGDEKSKGNTDDDQGFAALAGLVPVVVVTPAAALDSATVFVVVSVLVSVVMVVIVSAAAVVVVIVVVIVMTVMVLMFMLTAAIMVVVMIMMMLMFMIVVVMMLVLMFMLVIVLMLTTAVMIMFMFVIKFAVAIVIVFVYIINVFHVIDPPNS